MVYRRTQTYGMTLTERQWSHTLAVVLDHWRDLDLVTILARMADQSEPYCTAPVHVTTRKHIDCNPMKLMLASKQGSHRLGKIKFPDFSR